MHGGMCCLANFQAGRTCPLHHFSMARGRWGGREGGERNDVIIIEEYVMKERYIIHSSWNVKIVIALTLVNKASVFARA